MNHLETEDVLSELNHGLHTRYEEGDPIRLDVDGRPRFKILSFEPLVYDVYGKFLNRAPYVVGSLALRGFLSRPHPNGSTIVIAGVEAGHQGYGFYMDSHDPRTKPAIEGIAKLLDLQVEFTAY